MKPVQQVASFGLSVTLTSKGQLTAPAYVTIEQQVTYSFPPSPITSIVIHWGDGSSYTDNNPGNFSVWDGNHIYQAAGIYTITCIFVDAQGVQETASVNVTILPQPAPTPWPPAYKVWTGKFTGQDCLLLYNPPSNLWWLGTIANQALEWTNIGNTTGFGNISGDMFWVGQFANAGIDNILFYSIGDHNWFIGTVVGSGSSAKLTWTLAANTAGFGDISQPPPAHRFWVGAFDGTGKDNIMFFNQADSNWWLGQFDPTAKLSFVLASNTKGFSGGEADADFFVGKFASATVDSILIFFLFDNDWELGTFNGTTLSFNSCDNTTGFSDISTTPTSAHRFWVGNFGGLPLDNILFFNQTNENWWLGSFANDKLAWALAMNSQGFGGAEAAGEYFIGNFNGPSDDIFFYFPPDGDWLLGTFAAGLLAWNRAVNIAVKPGNAWQFGDISKDLFFLGQFSGASTSVVFVHPDGHWWQGTVSGGVMTWALVTQTLNKAW
jgi:hypothetical protein